MLAQRDNRPSHIVILATAGLVVLVLVFGFWTNNQSQRNATTETPQSASAPVVSTSVLVGVAFDPNRTPTTEEPGAVETSRALVRQAHKAPTTLPGTISTLGAPTNTFRLDIWLSVAVVLLGLSTIVGLELRKRFHKL